MEKLMSLFILLISTLHINAKGYLFLNGKSSYSIIVPATASASEKTAAKEMQSYLRQISGATLPIVNSIPANGLYIHIGYSRKVNGIKPDTADESFCYKVINNNLYIWGGSDRGTMYGVYSFLENELGVRWYTADCTIVPRKNKMSLKNYNHSETPVFPRRFDFYYEPLRNDAWCAHNKVNEGYTTRRNSYGNISAFCGTHTMFKFVPPEKYFASHPEYYSLIRGTRQKEQGELCLSNPDVLKIVKTNILQTIKANPDYWVYDVSQMDNSNYCQCDECNALATKYGGQAGVMIWFVNQVAEEVGKHYPDKKVGTFAYKYTRHAPTGIKPRDNVVVRLCNIECCFSHPLTDATCEKNAAFVKDLEDWSKLTSNIYIWDYVTHFQDYLVPYPNFNVLRENILFFASSNCIGVMEQGSHDAPWAEFSEMRQWVLSKLLWDCDADVNALVWEFCQDYYGEAGTEAYEYYQMVNNIPSSLHLTFLARYEKTCYDDVFLAKARNLLEQALQRVQGDSIKTKRVNRMLAQVYYMYTCRHPGQAKSNETYQKLRYILSTDPTNVKEGVKDLDAQIKEKGHT